jgi:YD repeat-containing protein
VTPAWRNVAAAAPSQHQYADASGRIAYTRDDYGNFTQVLRDALGRETRVVRFAGAVGNAPSLALAVQYDGRGRVTRRTEPAAGTKLFQYLPTGELVRSVQGANGIFQDGSAGVEIHVGSLGRVVERKVFKVGQDANCGWTQPIVSDDTTFDYDNPYQADAASYPLTLGRIAAMHNDTVSIAFGYTETGGLVHSRRMAVCLGVPRQGSADATERRPAHRGLLRHGLLDPITGIPQLFLRHFE